MSVDAARDNYGVVLKKDLSLDATATRSLREKMRGGRQGAAKPAAI